MQRVLKASSIKKKKNAKKEAEQRHGGLFEDLWGACVRFRRLYVYTFLSEFKSVVK